MCVCVCVCVCVRARARARSVTQSCPTLCDPMDCSLPGSSVYWILPARILEWVAISSSRGIFPTQRPIPHLLLYLLHWHVNSLPLVPPMFKLCMHSGKSLTFENHWFCGIFTKVWEMRQSSVLGKKKKHRTHFQTRKELWDLRWMLLTSQQEPWFSWQKRENWETSAGKISHP